MSNHPSRSAYTLIEILVATAVAMILMLAIMRMFGGIGESLNRTRAEMNLALELRRIQNLLQKDLDNRSMQTVTTDMTPATRDDGYFTYQEGPMWTPSENEPRLLSVTLERDATDLAAAIAAIPIPNCSLNLAINPDTGAPDSTVGDLDDFLAFTVQAGVTPYRARGLDVTGAPAKIGVVESTQAEVAWFVRGTTLYRRILIIDSGADAVVLTSDPTQTNPRTQPDLTRTDLILLWANNNNVAPTWTDNSTTPATTRIVKFYDVFDYSVRLNGNVLNANALGDLDERINRFGMLGIFPYPCAALPRFEDIDVTKSYTVRPGDPVVDHIPLSSPPISTAVPRDYWDWSDLVEPPYPTPRRGEDIVMKNVLSFDVKAWIDNDDSITPGTPEPAYFADLGWKGIDPTTPDPDADPYDNFAFTGRYDATNLPINLTPLLVVADAMPCVYDTWWTGNDGNTPFPVQYQPPYGRVEDECDPLDPLDDIAPDPAALRAIQITIRAYEPQFKTVQEVRVVKRLE